MNIYKKYINIYKKYCKEEEDSLFAMMLDSTRCNELELQ